MRYAVSLCGRLRPLSSMDRITMKWCHISLHIQRYSFIISTSTMKTFQQGSLTQLAIGPRYVLTPWLPVLNRTGNPDWYIMIMVQNVDCFQHLLGYDFPGASRYTNIKA